MINFDDWFDNYIDILNIIYSEFLTISVNKGINIKNSQESFDHFCYMIYSNSRNERLHNQNDYDYLN